MLIDYHMIYFLLSLCFLDFDFRVNFFFLIVLFSLVNGKERELDKQNSLQCTFLVIECLIISS